MSETHLKTSKSPRKTKENINFNLFANKGAVEFYLPKMLRMLQNKENVKKISKKKTKRVQKLMIQNRCTKRFKFSQDTKCASTTSYQR